MYYVAKISLGMTLLLLAFSTHAQAMQPCGKEYNLQNNLEKADVVFEGRYLRADVYSGELKKPIFYVDKPEKNFLTLTFSVEKKWTGNVSDKEVTIIIFPLEDKDIKDNKPFVNSEEFKKEWGDEPRILVLKSQDLDNGMYVSPFYSCETGIMRMTAENKAALEKKFPAAAQQ